METKDLQKYDEKDYNLLVKPEDLRASPLLNVELSVVKIDPKDVRNGGETHNIGGQLSPSRSALDKIADACGITFDEELSGTRKEGKEIYVGKAVGRRKNPDGTWRSATCEYEFDVEIRAKECKSERDVLQIRKFARQRADTGARLRVIRALTGLKTGFAPEELQKPFVFARYTVNVQAMMDDPQMKQAAINQALGVSQEIYGPATVRDVTPEAQQLEAPEEAAEEPEEPEEPKDPFAVDDEPPKLTPVDDARLKLEEWLNSKILEDNKDARDLIEATLNDENATLEALQNLLERCATYEEKMKAKAQGVAK